MSNVATQMRIDIYSDTVCPWCFLGKRRFDIALAERAAHAPRVTFRAFELNPELPLEGVERGAYLTDKLGGAATLAEMEATLTREGEAVGLKFRFDLIERIPNTRRSHLLIAYALRHGIQAKIKDRLMRAYFEEGVDIGDIDELARLGADCGLGENEVRSVLILRVGQDGIVAAQRHAAVLGIGGVPTFVFDGQYTISGAQEPATFIRILDQVTELAAAREAAP